MPSSTPKKHYYVMRSEGPISSPGTTLIIVGSYRLLAALIAVASFLLGVFVTLALHAN